MNYQKIIKEITTIQLNKSKNISNNKYPNDMFKLLTEQNKDLFKNFVKKKVEASITDILATFDVLNSDILKVDSLKYNEYLELNGKSYPIMKENGNTTVFFEIGNIVYIKINLDKKPNEIFPIHYKSNTPVTGIEEGVIGYIYNQINKNEELLFKYNKIIKLITNIIPLIDAIDYLNEQFEVSILYNVELLNISDEKLESFHLSYDMNIKEKIINILNEKL